MREILTVEANNGSIALPQTNSSSTVQGTASQECFPTEIDVSVSFSAAASASAQEGGVSAVSYLEIH